MLSFIKILQNSHELNTICNFMIIVSKKLSPDGYEQQIWFKNELVGLQGSGKYFLHSNFTQMYDCFLSHSSVRRLLCKV